MIFTLFLLWRMLILPLGQRGQDIWLFTCSYVADKPGDCIDKPTCNVKFHLLFKSYLYLRISFISHFNALQ